MLAPRPTARTIFLVVFAAAVLAVPAGAQRTPPAQIIVPVIGPVAYTDDFGQPRPGGVHSGNDILAERHAPVVAVEPGRIVFWTHSASAGCMLYLYGRSGTMYEYIHLNNDLTAHNDNRGACVPGVAYAPGLHDGDRVAAGALIGYVGDSGDADGLHPHLHFELHPGDGKAVSPFASLQGGEHLAQPLSGSAPVAPETSLGGDQLLARGISSSAATAATSLTPRPAA
jgi:murein DD-endopeptidase MepM/ murein hydrolase activator NlpD